MGILNKYLCCVAFVGCETSSFRKIHKHFCYKTTWELILCFEHLEWERAHSTGTSSSWIARDEADGTCAAPHPRPFPLSTAHPGAAE